jgi:hypothetical protein
MQDILGVTPLTAIAGSPQLRSSFDKIVRMRQFFPNPGPIWVW